MSTLSQTNISVLSRSFYKLQIIGLFLSAFILLVVYQKTGLDQLLIAPYFDAVAKSFPLKHQYFLEEIMHVGLRNCMILVAVVTLALSLAGNKIAPFRASVGAYSRQLLWVFVGMMLATSAISILKSFSIHGCPNDLIMYGGNLPYLKLFEALPKGVEAGHCFPAGHASGGFALLAFYYAFRDSNPKFAVAMLGIALVLGFAMGWTQIMRGEHFLSHNLWTAWVVWLVLLIQHLLWLPKKYTNSQA